MENAINAGLVGDIQGKGELLKRDLNFKKILSSNSNPLSNQDIKFPGSEVDENYTNMLEDKSIELIVISRHSNNFLQFAKEALLGGKHVRIIS
jgi:hypothetical protein